jgi:GNAT superfamily N-acetyltransferase
LSNRPERNVAKPWAKMKIRSATADEAGALTAIAFAAKRHWRYPESWILHWSDSLTISSEYITRHPTFSAVIEAKPVGFCAVQIQETAALLDHLWVLPSYMGRGVGRALFQRAEDVARASGAIRLEIAGDPHAEPFYSKMGATIHGRKPANMDGVERWLPMFQKTL